MSKRILYDHTATALKEIVVHDEENFTVLSHYNIDAHIASAKAKREAGRNRKSHWTEVCEIPDFVVERAAREGWLFDNVAWAKWYNDPQNKVFHTTDDIKRISGLEGV